MTHPAGLDFLVNKSDWKQHRFDDAPVPEIGDGQVLFRVDRFAFTANNISYALTGDMLGYWKFFPTEEGWGRLPVMGFGDVIRSAHPAVSAGERFFGFFPMSTHLVVQAQANPAGLVDTAAHRSESAPAYRQYTRTAGDPFYEAQHEDENMLLRGLFMTSFLVDDFAAENDFFGARCFAIASASSKTAIALASLLSARGRGPVVGLTAPRNRAFVEGLAGYDRAVAYDDLESLPSDTPTMFVDMAGNTKVTREVHERMGENLVFSQRIGGTHWDAGEDDGDIPGPERQFFFAPGQINKRLSDWGPQGFQERIGSSLRAFIDSSSKWLRVERGYGRDAVERVYAATLDGSASPAEGNILSLWEDEDAAAGR